MTSIFSISVARGLFKVALPLLCGMLFPAQGEPSAVSGEPVVNYSSWPKRPETWTRITSLLHEGNSAEARNLLEKMAGEGTLTPDCRAILNELKFRQILSPDGPDKQTYIVKRGDSLFSIAHKTKSSADYIIAVNNILQPSRLNVGDKFQVRPLNMKIVLDVKAKTLSLLDGGSVVKVYPVLALRSSHVGQTKTTVKSELGKSGAGVVTAMSEMYPASNKSILLKDGNVIEGTRNASAPSSGFFLSPEDCNELSLLVIPGNEVEIIH